MSKKSSYVLLAVGVIVVAVVIWGASGYLWQALLAMHGKH
jgi:hypothetical protein